MTPRDRERGSHQCASPDPPDRNPRGGGPGLIVPAMTAFIDSVGSGSAAAVPDVITLDVSARAIGPTVAEALAGSDAAARRIIDAATDAGLPARDRQTTGGRVVPVYDREGRPTTDFQATTSLRLRVRQPDRAGTLITTLAEAAATTSFWRTWPARSRTTCTWPSRPAKTPSATPVPAHRSGRAWRISPWAKRTR